MLQISGRMCRASNRCKLLRHPLSEPKRPAPNSTNGRDDRFASGARLRRDNPCFAKARPTVGGCECEPHQTDSVSGSTPAPTKSLDSGGEEESELQEHRPARPHCSHVAAGIDLLSL